MPEYRRHGFMGGPCIGSSWSVVVRAVSVATRLGDRHGRRRRAPQARITLVDRDASHLWKPLLHEVAAGSMDAPIHQVDYAAQAYWHGFEFSQGAMIGHDRAAKLLVAEVVDDEGVQVFPARELPYDTLVIAVGSTTNYFGVPGAREHAFALDTVDDAAHTLNQRWR